MGASFSLLWLAWAELLPNKTFASIREAELMEFSCLVERDITKFERGLKDWKDVTFQDILRSKDQAAQVNEKSSYPDSTQESTFLEPNSTKSIVLCPKLPDELDAAAIKLQKVYKSYRTRRNLADCAVVAEELWWKALDFASLKHSSVSFFHDGQHETAISRWARARTRAAKVGKGLSKDHKAQKLALRHWLEAIDPRHRYGHNLHLYYDVWAKTESSQPFFYWLDIGDGKEVNLEKCPRSKLHQECVKYLGPKEREAYEIIVEDGRLVYKQSFKFLDTTESSKWIFVLSTTRALYIGKKKKGSFHHSSFLSGGATTASGRLVAREGVLKAIWPYSGHYLPTEENFKQLIIFLRLNNVDLTEVETSLVDREEEKSSPKKSDTEQVINLDEIIELDAQSLTAEEEIISEAEVEETVAVSSIESAQYDRIESSNNYVPCKWTTGAGPRISCVRDYPAELQCKALEQVNLSPIASPSPVGKNKKDPIPSPRPSPAIISLSPALTLTLPKLKAR